MPAKPHTALRDDTGHLRYEECLTRDGFDGPYTILYHQHRPHTQEVVPVEHGWRLPAPALGAGGAPVSPPLVRRHYRSQDIGRRGGGPPVDARVPLLFNPDVTISVMFPELADPVYFSNGDGDDLYFIFAGGGTLRTPLGDLAFQASDYVFVPRGLPHRFLLEPGPQYWLSIECAAGFGLPRQWRNEVGQLRMDAPYSHRDFRRPDFRGPFDEGLRDLLVKRHGAFHGFRYQYSPLDVVGWDGTVYPWAFPILRFQPRVGQVHLPPTVHGTFAARGALICSFVPRPLDFHPDAIPCPYPHSIGELRRDHLLLPRQLHLASRGRPGQHLAPPGRHPARPASRRLRGEHRRARHRRAGGDARYLRAPARDGRGGRSRGPRVPRQLSVGS